jgi:hypothetical protein
MGAKIIQSKRKQETRRLDLNVSRGTGVKTRSYLGHVSRGTKSKRPATLG